MSVFKRLVYYLDADMSKNFFLKNYHVIFDLNMFRFLIKLLILNLN